MVLTILIFVIILGLLIFVHELGHFLLAKKNKVRVQEFGFGFPPRIFGLKRGETIYSINAIPLGGFVKIYGEEGQGKEDSRSFASKNIKQKAGILLAGVTMNIILAVIIFSLGHFIGLPTALSDEEVDAFPAARVEIIGLSPDSPAGAAGVKLGDQVIALINQQGQRIEPVKNVSQFQQFVEQEKGNNIKVLLARGDSQIQLEMTPRLTPPPGQGPLGVQLASVALKKYPWYQALGQGFLTTISLIEAMVLVIFEIVRNLFIEGTAGVELAGPVGIFVLTGQAASLGFIYLLQLTALLSINLAIINILPFPALDGGRILFLIIEKIKGSPISQKVQNLIHTIGFGFLILLMIVITYKDIARLF